MLKGCFKSSPFFVILQFHSKQNMIFWLKSICIDFEAGPVFWEPVAVRLLIPIVLYLLSINIFCILYT